MGVQVQPLRESLVESHRDRDGGPGPAPLTVPSCITQGQGWGSSPQTVGHRDWIKDPDPCSLPQSPHHAAPGKVLPLPGSVSLCPLGWVL